MKRAIVVGAGFGGLALAIRLQSAGVATTIVEARDKPGGRAYVWEREGFVPNVVFPTAVVPEGAGYLIYYGAAGACVPRLLMSCPGLQVTVTSRIRLATSFEWVYEVPATVVTAE